MGYNRPEAKALAKQAMRITYPHPMLVTLVYLLLTSVLTSLVSSLVTDPFTTFYYYVWDGVYGVEDLIRVLLTPRNVASFLVIQLLITVYQWIMSFGYTSYVLRMARNEQPNYWNLLDGFRTIGRAFLVYLLIYIFTTLWSLLFLVPAFIVMLVSALGGPMLMFLALLLVIAAAILSVIVTYRYRLAVYFLLDNPDMGALAAITESKRAMVGLEGRAVHPGSVLPGLVASVRLCRSSGGKPGPDLWARRRQSADHPGHHRLLPVAHPLYVGHRGQLLRLGGAWPLLLSGQRWPQCRLSESLQQFLNRTNIPALRSEGRDVCMAERGEAGGCYPPLQGRQFSPQVLQPAFTPGRRRERRSLPVWHTGPDTRSCAPHGRPQPPTRAPMGIKSARRK